MLEQFQLPCIDEKLADDGVTEINVRLLDQAKIAELGRVTKEGKIVLSAPLSLDTARIRQQVPRLTDEIEADVGERQILLQRRRVSYPFTQTLGEDEACVTELKRVAKQQRVRSVRRRRDCGGGTHRFFTSSGIA